MQNPTRRFDPLRVLSRPEREAHLGDYLRFLREREGEIDVRARRLSQREPRMRALEQDRRVWTGPLDREGFARCAAGERNQQVDLRTQWILAAAKANEGERYGVEIEVGRYLRRGRFPGVKKPELMLYVLMQESYHCRILLELCQSCGLTFESRDPGFTNRAFISLLGALPGALRWIPVLAGEIVGAAVFRLLHENLGLFDEQPEVRDRMGALIREIYLDEVLHVAFLRASLGRAQLLAARAFLPVVAGAVLRDVPQLQTLGCTARGILDRLSAGIEIPEEIDWLAADPAPVPVGTLDSPLAGAAPH